MNGAELVFPPTSVLARLQKSEMASAPLSLCNLSWQVNQKSETELLWLRCQAKSFYIPKQVMFKKRAIFPKTLPRKFPFLLLHTDNCCSCKSLRKAEWDLISEGRKHRLYGWWWWWWWYDSGAYTVIRRYKASAVCASITSSRSDSYYWISWRYCVCRDFGVLHLRSFVAILPAGAPVWMGRVL